MLLAASSEIRKSSKASRGSLNRGREDGPGLEALRVSLKRREGRRGGREEENPSLEPLARKSVLVK